QVQRRLRELGYVEVGNVDGDFGDLTEKAILLFRHDNRLPLNGAIDNTLMVALPKAEPRELSLAREDASSKDVREQIPEARASWWSKVVALWGMITAGAVSLGDFVLGNLGGARSMVDQVKSLFGAVPLPVYLLLIGGGLLFIYLKSRDGEKAAV